MKSGIEIISEERERQINEEGFSVERDKQYTSQQLAFAAIIYATPLGLRSSSFIERFFPWKGWYKPSSDRIKELAKAGALIAAEIDRLNNS